MSYLQNDIKQMKEWEEQVHPYIELDIVRDCVGTSFIRQYCDQYDLIKHIFTPPHEHLGHIMKIKIRDYSMYKFCSAYEFRRFELWNDLMFKVVDKNYRFRLSSFDEFVGDDWLTKWLDKTVPRSGELIINADKDYKRLYKKWEDEWLDKKLEKLSIQDQVLV